MSALAEQPVPNASFWNVQLLYSAMAELKWPSPPYHKPGGAIYMKDDHGKPIGQIYYPEGTDWGSSRRMGFAELDIQIEKLTPFGKHFNASEWSVLHIEDQLKLQERFTDGRTYGDAHEDTYPLREEWVACLSGYYHLTNWVKHNIKYNITNDKLD